MRVCLKKFNTKAEMQNSEEFKKNLERARALRAKQLVNR